MTDRNHDSSPANSASPENLPAGPEYEHFVPNFCQPQAVAIIVIGAELLAIVLVLADLDSWSGALEDLASTSLYVQWAALISAGLLCMARRHLVALPTWASAMIALALPLIANTGVTFSAYKLYEASLITGSWGSAQPLTQALIRNLVITAIISSVVLRYLYVRHQSEKRLNAQHRATLDALQARIRPHFLFNSLNTIISLVREQPHRAEEALLDMAELFRHNLRQSDRLTTLADEVELCRQYLALEQLRLGSRLAIEWQLDALDLNTRIPALVLQPLLENSVYHGIEPCTSGGLLQIIGSTSKGQQMITITNPVPLKDSGSPNSGHQIAIDNVRQRLNAHFGNNASLTLEPDQQEYRVRLTLPEN